MKTLRLAALLLALCLLAGCGSIAPREKTLLLSESTAQPGPSQEASALRFEVNKITRLPLDKLDPNGVHPDPERAVIGWADADNLAALSVQQAQEETGEPRAVTQFLRINYQYGFYDPMLTLDNVAAECFDISADGSLAAYVAGSSLEVYSLLSGARVAGVTREVLASRLAFAEQGSEVYFATAGGERAMERLDAVTGQTRVVLRGQTARPLAVNDKGMLFYVLDQGAQQVGASAGESAAFDLLTGGRAGSCRILPSGEGLLVYDGDLYRVDAAGAELAQRGVIAFDLAADGMHIAYAVRNDDDSVDVRIGYWGGSRIINDKLTYKDIGIAVDTIYFSPDLRKLYLQGRDESGTLTAYTFEFR